MPSGWIGSDRRDTLPPNWPATQLRILNRDFHRCQWIRYDTDKRCLAPARAVDHIVSHGEGGGDEDANLQSLCDYHHNKKSGGEGGRASGRVRAAKAAAAKPLHPGLMARPAPSPSTPSRPPLPASRDSEGPFPF